VFRSNDQRCWELLLQLSRIGDLNKH